MQNNKNVARLPLMILPQMNFPVMVGHFRNTLSLEQLVKVNRT